MVPLCRAMSDDLLSSKEFGNSTHHDTMYTVDPAEKKVREADPKLFTEHSTATIRRLFSHVQEMDSSVLLEAFLMRNQVTNLSQENVSNLLSGGFAGLSLFRNGSRFLGTKTAPCPIF